MEVSLNERHIKDFIKLLQCGSRFGDDLCISANKDGWEMAVTNSSRSAFCLFKVQPRFFSRYKALGSPQTQRRGVKCQLLGKSVLAVLGKASAINAIERIDLKIHDPQAVLRSRGSAPSSAAANSSEATKSATGDTDERGVDDAEETRQGSVLIIRLICKHGVTKKHSLFLAHTEFLRADVDPNSTPSGFIVSARTLRDWLEHFSLGTGPAAASLGPAGIKADNQLGWLFGRHEVRIKSWEGSSKGMCTELKFETAEFGVDEEGRDRYWLHQERTDLTLPMKEFTLADALNIDLAIAFSDASQPLTLTYSGGEDDDFDIFCAIATTQCDAFDGVSLPSNGSGGGSGNGGGGGARSHNQAQPAQDAARRTRSDLTDVDPAEGGPAQGVHSNGHGASRAGSRQRSETPGRRRTSRLDLAPAPAPARDSQHAARTAASGHAAPQGTAQLQAEEPLFFPGGSQEDGAGALPASQRLTNQQVMAMAGMDDLSENDLAAALDNADEEDYEEEMTQRRMAGERVPHPHDDSMQLDAEEEQAAAAQFEAEQRAWAPVRASRTGQDASQGRFVADDGIFGTATAGQSTRGRSASYRKRTATSSRSPDKNRAFSVQGDGGGRGREVVDDEELDSMDATQHMSASGRARSFPSLLDDAAEEGHPERLPPAASGRRAE